MKYKQLQKNKGFVILFAVTLAAILLSITMGVSNIALKEIKFGTSAKDTNEAFFAADTGAECALINDKSTSNIFTGSDPKRINCNGNDLIFVYPHPTLSLGWYFTLHSLGNTGQQGCAYVTVDKSSSTTTVTSKGYNNPDCNVSSSTVVERQLEVTY